MITRIRISLLKEDRIFRLRSQGYCYDAIARIVNVAPNSITAVIRRVRKRPPAHIDPIRRGRRRSWLSDAQLDDIRYRRMRGETLLSLGRRYHLSESAICSICKGRYHKVNEDAKPYPFSFVNRLAA